MFIDPDEDLRHEARKLMEIERRFNAIIANASPKDDSDYSFIFDDLLRTSREAYHTRARIVYFFHPFFVDVLTVHDKEIMNIIESIKNSRDNFNSVLWYLHLVDLINQINDEEIEAHSDDAVDTNLMKADRKDLFAKLLSLQNDSTNKQISHKEFLTFASEMWRDEYFLIQGEDDILEYWNRLIEIGPLLVDKSVPQNVKDYYHEMRMSYANDLTLSCLALCRALIEASLHDLLTKKGVFKKENINSDEIEIYKLAIYCRKYRLLDKNYIELAEKVRKKGNEMLHSKDKYSSGNSMRESSTQEVLKIVKMTSSIAECIYRNII